MKIRFLHFIAINFRHITQYTLNYNFVHSQTHTNLLFFHRISVFLLILSSSQVIGVHQIELMMECYGWAVFVAIIFFINGSLCEPCQTSSQSGGVHIFNCSKAGEPCFVSNIILLSSKAQDLVQKSCTTKI